MDTFLERLPGRGITYTSYTNKSEAPVTHLQMAEASLKIDSAAAHARLAAAIMDEAKDGRMTMQERVARAHIAYSTGLAREATDILFTPAARRRFRSTWRFSAINATFRRWRITPSCTRRRALNSMRANPLRTAT